MYAVFQCSSKVQRTVFFRLPSSQMSSINPVSIFIYRNPPSSPPFLFPPPSAYLSLCLSHSLCLYLFPKLFRSLLPLYTLHSESFCIFLFSLELSLSNSSPPPPPLLVICCSSLAAKRFHSVFPVFINCPISR